jgi:hypothetical protein
MLWLSGKHLSPAVISDREKNSVAYRCLAAVAAARAGVRGVSVTPAAAKPADAGRGAAPAPSAPIVPAATQVATARANTGRLTRCIRDVISFLTESQ